MINYSIYVQIVLPENHFPENSLCPLVFPPNCFVSKFHMFSTTLLNLYSQCLNVIDRQYQINFKSDTNFNVCTLPMYMNYLKIKFLLKKIAICETLCSFFKHHTF